MMQFVLYLFFTNTFNLIIMNTFVRTLNVTVKSLWNLNYVSFIIHIAFNFHRYTVSKLKFGHNKTR